MARLIAERYDSTSGQGIYTFTVEEGTVIIFKGLTATQYLSVNGAMPGQITSINDIYQGGDVEWIVSKGDTAKIVTIATLTKITGSSSASHTITYNSDGSITVKATVSRDGLIGRPTVKITLADGTSKSAKVGTFSTSATAELKINAGVSTTVTITVS